MERLKFATALTICLGVIVLILAAIASECYDGYEWWVHRHETEYIVYARDVHPYSFSQDVPMSPTRLEPSGCARLKYVTVVKEYELKRLGYNPANEIPYDADYHRLCLW